MAAAGCLLLIACANVASLELAGAVAQLRSRAIHAALGASRPRLLRTCLAEGAILLGVGAVVAWFVAAWAVQLLAESLPPSMSNPLINPVDLDARALTFMAVAATITWLLVSVPVALRATRISIADLLNRDDRTLATSGSAGLRRFLMMGQIAVTVALMIGAALMIRTYASQISLERGFESEGVAYVRLLPPSRARAAELEREILPRLQAQPGVLAVARADGAPPSSQAGISGRLRIHGGITTDEQVKLAGYSVDPDFFATLRMRMVAGRPFTAADPPHYIVIDERLARRYSARR